MSGDRYPTLAQKATKLADGISRAQAFQDGNQRTAWLAALALLEINGLTVDHRATSQEEAAARVLRLDGTDQRLRIQSGWLNERLMPCPDAV